MNQKKINGLMKEILKFRDRPHWGDGQIRSAKIGGWFLLPRLGGEIPAYGIEKS